MNSHMKKPRMTVNYRIGSRKVANSQSHIREIGDKRTAYNEGRLYLFFLFCLFLNIYYSLTFLNYLHTFSYYLNIQTLSVTFLNFSLPQPRSRSPEACPKHTFFFLHQIFCNFIILFLFFAKHLDCNKLTYHTPF